VGSATGFVVAGGHSRRMGSDKALLPWGAGTLLDHAIARLRAVTDDVRILCGTAPRYQDRGLPVITDGPGGTGALVGIQAGLVALERPLGLFLAVDLPHVPVLLLRQLIEAGRDADLVVPRTSRGDEPLCAVYARTCLASVRDCVARGELRMTGFWAGLRVKRLEAADRLVLNVNEPADYERAKP
jgi:molybdopterin-guanine dinucleotide biosynthesis protein A